MNIMKAKLSDTHPYENGVGPQGEFLFDLKDVRLACIDHLGRIEVLIDTGNGHKQQWFEYDEKVWKALEDRFDEEKYTSHIIDFVQSFFKDTEEKSANTDKKRKSFQERLDEAIELNKQYRGKQ